MLPAAFVAYAFGGCTGSDPTKEKDTHKFKDMYPGQSILFEARITKHCDFVRAVMERHRESQPKCPAAPFCPKYQQDFYQG